MKRVVVEEEEGEEEGVMMKNVVVMTPAWVGMVLMTQTNHGSHLGHPLLPESVSCNPQNDSVR